MASSQVVTHCFFFFQVVVSEDKSRRMGSACHLTAKCSHCSGVLGQTMTSQKTGLDHTGHDINRRIISAAAVNGIGFTQLSRFFALLNMPPPMHQKTWQFYQKTLYTGAHRAADSHLQEAAELVREMYAEMKIGEPTPDGQLDVSVSFDGSWHRRGRCSHTGIATVIEVFSGLILDFITLSNYCLACELGPKVDSPGYMEWFKKHESHCQKTTNCSSAAMETEAAVVMWGRSLQLHSFQYMEMLGDGDGKAHGKVNGLHPYGPEASIKKIECVNHVTKRMGTALRTLVEKRKAQKLPIGGRGKLTDDRIKKLTNYYGRAIKDNAGTLKAMEDAVWASFFHTLSTDDDPHHERCPAGRQSWCFYKRAEASSAAPRPHSKPLPRDIAESLVPIYKRLGDPQLLTRCLSGKTQNSNESFHSMVWRACPKERWAAKRTVDTAVAICVQRFNKGSTALLDVLTELDIVAGTNAEDFVESEDFKRAKSATRTSSQNTKDRRKMIDAIHRQEREGRRGQEGQVYAPGAF